MQFNIDVVIFIGFLSINLAVGLYYSTNVKNIQEYAIGKRNFSTAAIAATIAATWIGGGVLSQTITETYKQGLYFIIPALGDSLVLLVVGYFFAPRMAEFLGNLSIAESMGNLYGKNVKLITSLISIMSCIGAVAVQFKVSASILQLFFNVSSFYGVLAGAIIVILYSSIGGIKAVTFTDVVQIFTFAVIIPIISLVIWGTLGGPEEVISKISKNPNFDLKQVFNIYNSKFVDSVLLFLFFIIPTLEPAVFQRIVMAKDTLQVRRSFVTASFICLFISLVIAWIGVLLYAEDPNLEPNNLLTHIIDNYSYPGLKGIIAIGVMAVIMSTADSYINSAAVIITNDLCKVVNFKWAIKEGLLSSRIFAVLIGVLGFFLAFNTKSLLDLTFLIWGSYMPIISVPLILAIFGFRSTSKSVLTGMAAGVSAIFIFKFFNLEVREVIPAMLANAGFLLGSHYILGEPGGWVGIKDNEPLIEHKRSKKENLEKFLYKIKSFNIWAFGRNNLPKQDSTYALFGLFCIISVFSTMYSLPQEMQEQHQKILEFIYYSVLISSTVLLTLPIWPHILRREKLITIIWNILLPYILVFTPTLLVIISDFGQFQLMIFLLNLVIISLILRWQVAMLMIGTVTILSIFFYKWYIGVGNINAVIEVSLQFKIMYVLLLVSSVLIALIKPKQERQELTEEKNERLQGIVGSQEQQLKEALAMRAEFIRNITHEYHTPMTGITTMAQVLAENYDKLNDKERREAAEIILKSSSRLKSFDENIVSFSKLSQGNYELNFEQINLSNLLSERLEVCRKLYEESEGIRQFIVDIEDNIILRGDAYYIKQLIENLIINAITYCKKGKIAISLKESAGVIHLTIIDEGIGIQPSELLDIFHEFNVSLRTYMPASGRGVGLALCKKICEIHKATIKAESDGFVGAAFKITFPLII